MTTDERSSAAFLIDESLGYLFPAALRAAAAVGVADHVTDGHRSSHQLAEATGMAAMSDPENEPVGVSDFPATGTVVDVGGGHGGLLLEVLRLDVEETAVRWSVAEGVTILERSGSSPSSVHRLLPAASGSSLRRSPYRHAHTHRLEVGRMNSSHTNTTEKTGGWVNSARGPWAALCAAAAVVLGPAAVTASALDQANAAPMHHVVLKADQTQAYIPTDPTRRRTTTV